MAERSVPVPVWNSTISSWEPIDFRNGQRVVEWPHAFSPQLLPIPEYHEGDRVQFVRDETCACEGAVRLVLFQGDISCFQEEPSETMKYPNPDADDIIYLVTARGHDHRIKASHILGCFVSLERISRVLVLATWIIRTKTLTFLVVCFLSPPILLFSKVVVSWYVSHVSIERTT